MPDNATGSEVAFNGPEIPLFSVNTLEKNLQDLGPALVKIVREESAQFIKDNKDSVIQLSEDVVRAILIKDAFEKIAIPVITPGMSLEECARVETYLAARSEIFSLVASAELKNAQRVAELKAKVKSAAAKVLGVLLGLGLKAVIG